MQIDIRHVNAPVSDALCEFAKRHITRALRPFAAEVSRVDVCTRDGKGPDGLTDVECGIAVRADSLEEPMIVTQHGPDAYAAILSACAYLREAASRSLEGAAPDRRATAREGEEVTAATSGSHPHIVVTAIDGEQREISLVYPAESDPARGRISVFAPVGAALLGLSVGQTIDWPLPEGQLKRYRVEQVVYQPEAAGELHL